MTASRTRRRLIGFGVVIAVAVGVAVVFGTGLGRDPTKVSSNLVGKPAPELAGRTLDGGQFDLRDYRGQWVLVNAWASWCTACREEHPVLVKASRTLRDEGLRVVGINMRDKPAEARRFQRELGGAFGPSVIDRDAKISVRWGVFALPETYLVDPRGVVADKQIGPVTEEWVRTRVMPRLEDAP